MTRIESGGVAIEFVRRQDRFAHTIQLLQDGLWRPALTSCEGNSESPWPTSPPLQELHVETRDGLVCALLVGRCGTAFWSAACEALPQGGIRWDVACRVQQPPGFLGSTYALAGDAPLTDAAQKLAQNVARAIRCADDPATQTHPVPGAAVCLQVIPAIVGPPPATIRWQYVLLDASARM